MTGTLVDFIHISEKDYIGFEDYSPSLKHNNFVYEMNKLKTDGLIGEKIETDSQGRDVYIYFGAGRTTVPDSWDTKSFQGASKIALLGKKELAGNTQLIETYAYGTNDKPLKLPQFPSLKAPTAPPPKPQPSAIVSVAKDFRKTSAGISLGKKLFSKDVLSISPTQIVALLRAAGVNVPKEVVITADIAQIIMSGGAVASNVATGASIGAYAQPTALVCMAVMDIMEICGLVDPQSPMADAMTLGIDIVLVVGSYGTNVIADLKFVVDVVTIASDHPDVVGMANSECRRALQNWLKYRQLSQVDALSTNFKAYQEGNLSIFAVMGKVAEESPDYFYNYFPNQKTFVPPTTLHQKFALTTSADTLFGGHTEGSGSAEIDIETVRDNSHSNIAREIFDEYCGAHLDAYRSLNTMNFPGVQPINIIDLALLSMIPPFFESVTPDFKLDELLKAQFLTPHDLDPNLLNDLVTDSYTTHQNAITLNGVDYLSKTEINLKNQSALDKKIIRDDQTGHINSLLQNPKAQKRIREWGDIFWYMKDEKVSSTLKESWRLVLRKRAQDDAYFGNLGTIRNLWSAIQMINMLRADPYFKDLSILNFYSWVPTIPELEEKHKKLLMLSQARHLNAQAYKNIAFYLGKKPSELKLIQKGSPGKPAIFE